ncbi:MAG: hypothetical protein ACLFVJ_07920 [Persicimonas sp.]
MIARSIFLRWMGLAALITLAAGCFDDNQPPEGLRTSEQSGGPQVVFNLDDWPFPDIPFPNDVATRADPDSPTGRRINVSYFGATDAEAKVRKSINRMSGFGVYTPISVSFNAPLDVERVIERHQESVPDFADDVVYLVDVDPDSPEFGELKMLDMGRGNFPLTLNSPNAYFANDSRSQGSNLLFETVAEEDTNGNGELDPMEDTDDDGVWDRPNTRTPDGDPLAPGELLDFYERETNSLIIRSMRPLRSETTYAVVLTSDLVGEDGSPVESPFPAINHARQTPELEPLRDILPNRFPDRFDSDLDGVQFAWTFTTGSPTRELEAVRAGLYGHGPLSWLAEEYPAEFKLIHNPGPEDDEAPMTFSLDELIPLLTPVAADALGSGGDTAVLEEALLEIEYMVSGSFMSPYFLGDSSGLADPGADAPLKETNPLDVDEVFDIDLADGTARVRPGEVTFHCAVPSKQEGREPPYPTIIYSHAISSTRLEMIAFAGQMAKFGLATCTIDAAGHGLDIPSNYDDLLDDVAANVGLPQLREVLTHDRARDLDNDGAVETGEDYFVSDILHSRDMIRQTTIDQMQLVRILRSFDGEARWDNEIDEEDPWIKARRPQVAGWDQDGDGEGEIRGDFNGDGTVDFGGDQTYLAWGTSLGGLQTAVLSGIEPTIRAGASNAGGGGLGDIATRTDIGNVRVGVFLPMFGPLLTGTAPTEDGEINGPMRLQWHLASGISERRVPMGTIDDIENGDQIVLRNLERETREFIPDEERTAVVHVRDGRFRVGIAADADDAMVRRAKLGLDPEVSVEQDLMGCREVIDCGGVECEEDHYCAPDNTCTPLAECFPNFDASTLDGDARAELEPHLAADPTEFGDQLIIEVRSADGTLKQTIDTFPVNAVFQNVLYPAGAPLAALATGWGLQRQTPRFRKFLAISQMMLEAADPAIYARHYFEDPLSYPYEDDRYRDGWTNFLTVGTLGDQTVPINTALSLARASGVLDSQLSVDEYGTTENQFLVDNYVYEGLYWLNRFPDYENTLFDPDDLDNGTFMSTHDSDDPDDPNPDAEHPLRATVETDYGVSALRLPYLNTHGEHTFNVPRTDRGFGIATFMTNQVGWYLTHAGQSLSDDPCLQELSMEDCGFFDTETFDRPEF